jgi:transposase
MMGRARPPQGKLFYDGFRLEERVRQDHPLRTIRKLVDFDFAYREVKDCYGYNGNVSVPPPVILKLMFLLFYYDVSSERELLNTLPERLDWLWFLDYDLDDPTPDHSVLSKARERWGVEAFRCLFTRMVEQCVALGLVDGRKVYCDSSLVDANAANDSIKKTNRFLVIYGKMEQRLNTEGEKAETESQPERPYVSATDPDAAVVPGRGGARARFKTHRLVDDRHGVITATEITPGDVNEAHRLPALMAQHETTTEQRARTVVADSKYGTIDNYLRCHDRNVVAHMPDMKRATATGGRKRGIFSDAEFRYCPDEDVYICPAGKRLTRKRFHKERQSYDYCGSKKMCGKCRLRQQCTTAQNGRSIKRHVRQADIDQMRRETRSWYARADLNRRKHLMEGSFADGANNHGLKRARWRGLKRMAIQDYFIAAVQNIRLMVKRRTKRAGTGVQAAGPAALATIPTLCRAILALFYVHNAQTAPSHAPVDLGPSDV